MTVNIRSVGRTDANKCAFFLIKLFTTYPARYELSELKTYAEEWEINSRSVSPTLSFLKQRLIVINKDRGIWEPSLLLKRMINDGNAPTEEDIRRWPYLHSRTPEDAEAEETVIDDEIEMEIRE